jgi:hypothetical protein
MLAMCTASHSSTCSAVEDMYTCVNQLWLVCLGGTREPLNLAGNVHCITQQHVLSG